MPNHIPVDPKIAASPRQQKLLAALDANEWRKAPRGTLGPTLVALMNRGVIEGRFSENFGANTYADAYVWRLASVK